MQLMLVWSLLGITPTTDCRTITDSTQHRQPSTPSYYEDYGACPFECCTYRRWTVNADTIFYKGRSTNSPAVFHAKKGEHVTGLTGVVITLRPGKALVKKVTTLGIAGMHQVRVKAGDILYLLHYEGEGVYKFWYRGRIYESDMPFAPDLHKGPGYKESEYLQQLSEPQTVWWVKVKNGHGQIGWSKQDNHFDDMDACG